MICTILQAWAAAHTASGETPVERHHQQLQSINAISDTRIEMRSRKNIPNQAILQYFGPPESMRTHCLQVLKVG